jgi:hypothetical protein
MYKDRFVTLKSGAQVVPLEDWIRFNKPLIGKPGLGGVLTTEQHLIDFYNLLVAGLNSPPLNNQSQ